MSCDKQPTNQSPSWREAYPKSSTKTPPTIAQEDLLSWMRHGKKPGKDFLVVDLRRSDHDGGFLRGFLNLPIESLHPALPTLHVLCKNAGVKTVILYCVTSRGRGNWAAGWFLDYLKAQGETEVESVALFEGILGWALAGDEYTEHIDEFVSEAWKAEDAARHPGCN